MLICVAFFIRFTGAKKSRKPNFCINISMFLSNSKYIELVEIRTFLPFNFLWRLFNCLARKVFEKRTKVLGRYVKSLFACKGAAGLYVEMPKMTKCPNMTNCPKSKCPNNI